mmetsp:Transcript_64546/g.185631  ORF Transcript_64546/g.185631 Transcript_64546/m.185631 type:complete len:270 (-) Transcript_64546:19-828(-)
MFGNTCVERDRQCQRHPQPGELQLRNLCVDRHVLVGFQILFYEDRAEAREEHLGDHEDQAHGVEAAAATSLAGPRLVGLVHHHEGAHAQGNGQQHVPLQEALPLASDGPNDQSGDQQLALQQDLVSCATHDRHGLHLQEIAERIQNGDRAEHLERLRIPALLQALHAATQERDAVAQDDVHQRVDDTRRGLAVWQLAIRLRDVDDDGVHTPHGHEDREGDRGGGGAGALGARCRRRLRRPRQQRLPEVAALPHYVAGGSRRARGWAAPC